MFADRQKARFQDRLGTRSKFERIMLDWKNNPNPLVWKEVHNKVSILFKGEHDLVAGFNAFEPQSLMQARAALRADQIQSGAVTCLSSELELILGYAQLQNTAGVVYPGDVPADTWGNSNVLSGSHSQSASKPPKRFAKHCNRIQKSRAVKLGSFGLPDFHVAHFPATKIQVDLHDSTLNSDFTNNSHSYNHQTSRDHFLDFPILEFQRKLYRELTLNPSQTTRFP